MSKSIINIQKLKQVFVLFALLLSIFCIFVTMTTGNAYADDGYTVTYDANGGSFTSGNTQNIVTYKLDQIEEIKTSKTANVSEDGSNYSGGYGNNQAITDVVTIPDATALKVTITYATESSNYDWVAVYDGSVAPSASNYSNSISGKLGGIKTTQTFTVPGNTVQFFFRSDSRTDAYFGYYAVIEGEGLIVDIVSGSYKEPISSIIGSKFMGWYTDAECTDGNELDLTTLTSDITVYAKYVGPYTVIYDTNSNGVFNNGTQQNIVVYEKPSPVKTSKTYNVNEDGSGYSGED